MNTVETQITVYNPRAGSLFPAGVALERLCTGAQWGEGPVWIDEEIKSNLVYGGVEAGS